MIQMKKVGLEILLLGTCLTVSNTLSYYITCKKLEYYSPQQVVKKIHEDRKVLKGFPVDQIGYVITGIGRNLAYNKYELKDKNNL